MNNAAPDQRHEDLCLMCLVMSHLYWTPVDIRNSILKSAVRLPVNFPKLDHSTKQTQQGLVAVTDVSSSVFKEDYDISDHFRFVELKGKKHLYFLFLLKTELIH